MFAARKACVVAGPYTHLTWAIEPEIIDPDQPLESLARQSLTYYIHRNLDSRINLYSRLCQDYSVDGLIFHSSRTCRPLSIGQLEVMEGLMRQLGIPGISIEGDIGDLQFISEAQIENRVQALIETIAAQKGHG
jgi:benzoyl-CoA reductase/2-hydroxyglutaryl-CoA dehydratase subunit BcrC/BadD/HgdB